MMPCLFDLGLTTSFYFDNSGQLKNYGYGFFTNVENCEVKQVLNGEFILSMTISLNDRLAEKIATGMAILAQADFENDTPQVFIIRNIKLSNTSIEISADHVKYIFFNNMILNQSSLEPYITSSMTVPQLITYLENGSELILPNYFDVIAGVGTQKTCRIDIGSERLTLGDIFEKDKDGIFAQTGCELRFDNFNIYIDERRGDTEAKKMITYGSNISSYSQEMNDNEQYTHILPFATVGTVPEYTGDTKQVCLYSTSIISTGSTSNFTRILPVDFSDKLNSKNWQVNPSNGYHYADVKSELQRLGNDYKNSHPDLAYPSVNVVVDYQETLREFEKLKLGDVVRVMYKPLNYNKKHRVTEIVFDPIRKKYKSVTIGQRKYTLYDFIQKNVTKNVKFN